MFTLNAVSEPCLYKYGRKKWVGIQVKRTVDNETKSGINKVKEYNNMIPMMKAIEPKQINGTT